MPAAFEWASAAERFPPNVPYRVSAEKTGRRLIGEKARIAPLEPADWSPEVRRLLDPTGSGRSVAAVYRTFAQHTRLYAPRQVLSEYIRTQSTLDARTRELLIMRIGALCRSDYEWAAHAPAGPPTRPPMRMGSRSRSTPPIAAAYRAACRKISLVPHGPQGSTVRQRRESDRGGRRFEGAPSARLIGCRYRRSMSR